MKSITPRIEILPKKKLVGKSVRMSFSDNKTAELWQSFMPVRNSVLHAMHTGFYAIQCYDDVSYFKHFNPQSEFTKFAMVEVSNFDDIPEGMEAMILESGLYAIFIYKGLPKDFPKLAQYIFTQWLPNSEYELDHRPHFELLGDHYKPNDKNSKEEVWIPIKRHTEKL